MRNDPAHLKNFLEKQNWWSKEFFYSAGYMLNKPACTPYSPNWWVFTAFSGYFQEAKPCPATTKPCSMLADAVASASSCTCQVGVFGGHLCPIDPMPAISKMDLLLAKVKTSVLAY